MMLTFIEHLNGVYAACNEHLLEQGRKRDQVIAFYIVLLAFMITSGRQLAQMTNQIIVHSGLIVIGAICIRTIADLRSWHTQYLDCMKIINWGARSSGTILISGTIKASAPNADRNGSGKALLRI